MLAQTKQNVGRFPEQVSADSGYFTYANLEYAEQAGIDAFIPDNMLEWLDGKPDAEKRYDKGNFQHDARKDIYICPEGKVLRPYTQAKYKGARSITIYAGESCGECQAKERCTKAAKRFIWRDGRESLVYRMRDKLRSEHGKLTYLKRMYTVEPVFADMKWNRRKLMTNLRGLVKVGIDFLLMCLTHNISKIAKAVREGQTRLALPISASKPFDSVVISQTILYLRVYGC